MLVFGESMLNDAVSIVLTSTALEIVQQPDPFAKTAGETLLAALYRFTYVFIVSALVGAIVGFFSALVCIYFFIVFFQNIAELVVQLHYLTFFLFYAISFTL